VNACVPLRIEDNHIKEKELFFLLRYRMQQNRKDKRLMAKGNKNRFPNLDIRYFLEPLALNLSPSLSIRHHLLIEKLSY
jgi:hypothetical protein